MMDLTEAKAELALIRADGWDSNLVPLLLVAILQELRANAANRAAALENWRPIGTAGAAAREAARGNGVHGADAAG